jgi:hypothetical protein
MHAQLFCQEKSTEKSKHQLIRLIKKTLREKEAARSIGIYFCH